MQIDVINLRFKYPNVKRSFKSPLGITFQLTGIAGMFYMLFNIFPDPVVKAQIYQYALIFLLITLVYSVLWVKIKMKKKLFETTAIEELLIEDTSGEIRDINERRIVVRKIKCTITLLSGTLLYFLILNQWEFYIS